MKTGAKFDDDRKFRFQLWRIWDETKPLVTFCLLNPSTADESKNDPTVERCQRRAVKMGFGGMIVVNVFALRATDPRELYDHHFELNSSRWENNEAILEAARKSSLVICGWGNHGNLHGRGREVLEMLRIGGIDPHVLKMNQNGTPAHPLYIGYNVKPKRFFLKA